LKWKKGINGNQKNMTTQCPKCKKMLVEYDKQTQTYYCEGCKWERDRTLLDFGNEVNFKFIKKKYKKT